MLSIGKGIMLRKAKLISSAERNTMWSRDADVTLTCRPRQRSMARSRLGLSILQSYMSSVSRWSGAMADMVRHRLHKHFLKTKLQGELMILCTLRLRHVRCRSRWLEWRKASLSVPSPFTEMKNAGYCKHVYTLERWVVVSYTIQLSRLVCPG